MKNLKLNKKKDGHYFLSSDGWAVGSTDSKWLGNPNEEGMARYKLSLKNCEAIENGYDLDELADKLTGQYATLNPKSFKRGVLYGFQKALELLGDKKFNEDDMKLSYNANEEGWVSFNAFMEDLLQQTEWNCIIFVDEKTNKPLLDNEGNLILKSK